MESKLSYGFSLTLCVGGEAAEPQNNESNFSYAEIEGNRVWGVE